MVATCRMRLTLAACLATLLLCPVLYAQPNVYNPAVPGPGQQFQPTAPGYSVYTNPAQSYGPSLAPVAVAPTYTSPYALNTAPGYSGGYFPGYFPGYMRLGPVGSAGVGLGTMYQGMASLTQATGQYWNDIQSASLARERTRQEAMVTARKRVELEQWYEQMRPTAPKMRDAERRADLDWARKDPPKSEIWSGRSLNVLLKSILASPTPTRGPNISLEPNILRGLNLTDGTTRGNLALAKDEGKIAWPEALDDTPFDDVRDRFSKNFEKAVRATGTSAGPDRATLRELRDDLKRMNQKLDDLASDLAPSRYIEARRLLNKLNDNVKGLSDPRLCKACHSDWRNNVRNVSDLVNHCLKNGLEFGPASSEGDEPAYTVAYHALRSYERELVHSLTASR